MKTCIEKKRSNEILLLVRTSGIGSGGACGDGALGPAAAAGFLSEGVVKDCLGFGAAKALESSLNSLTVSDSEPSESVLLYSSNSVI